MSLSQENDLLSSNSDISFESSQTQYDPIPLPAIIHSLLQNLTDQLIVIAHRKPTTIAYVSENIYTLLNINETQLLELLQRASQALTPEFNVKFSGLILTITMTTLNNYFVMFQIRQTDSLDFDKIILDEIDAHIVINDHGQILHFNKVAESIFGYTRFEAKGNNISMIMPPPFSDQHDSFLAKYRKTGNCSVINTIREVKAKRKNGEIFPMELGVTQHNEYFVAVIRDLSSKKKYSDFDTTMEKYIRYTVFNKLPMGLLILRFPSNMDSQIILINKYFLDLFNLQYENIINTSTFKSLPALVQHDTIWSSILSTMEKNKSFCDIDSHVMGHTITVCFFPIDTTTVGIIFKPQTDTSKTKNIAKSIMENIRRENAIFLSNIGHDMKTSLNSIQGNINLIQSAAHLTPEQDRHVNDTNECTFDLMNIIDDIITYSRIEIEDFMLDFKSFRLKNLIEECTDLISRRAAEKLIQVHVSVGRKVPEFIIGDYDKLKRILQNIVINAVKYTDYGKIVIRVAVSKNRNRGRNRPLSSGFNFGISKSNRKIGFLSRKTPRRTMKNITPPEEEEPTFKYILKISVTDTGTGIPKSMHDKIFQPFTKVKDKNKMYSGTGLGLYICQWYAEKMGGKIKVDSEVGIGSTFHIKVLINEDTNLKSIRQHTQIIDFTGINVLIIDSNVDDRVKLSKILMGWNLSTFMCDNLHEMSVYLQNPNLKFDILFFDITLEDKLTEKYMNDIANIPVIGLRPNSNIRDSGGSSDQTPNTELIYEVIFTKPVEDSRIFTTCTKLLANHKIDEDDSAKLKLRVMIIDDDYQSTFIIKSLLKQMGYVNIQSMPDGFTLIKQLKKKDPVLNFDVVLMDIYLPRYTGDILTTAIHRKIPDPNKRPLIIGMTASFSTEIKNKAFAAGVDAFLRKPLDRKELDTLLNIIMHKRGLI